eukprot:Skav212299  [mRNA]  locus=scaffold732:641530:643934:- [translate_table: standard]
MNTRFFEQVLRRGSLQGGEFGLTDEQAEKATLLGAPSHRKAPRPKRMPVPERYHAATDPQAVTTWGKMAEIRMAGRGDVLRVASETLPPGVPYPWTKLGPPYQPPDYVQAAKPFLADWSRRVRMLAIITVHGALDLEMPELLLHLFPQWFQARFLLGGAFRGRPCNKTEGSAVMDALCASHHARARRPQRRRRESPGFLRRWGSRGGEFGLTDEQAEKATLLGAPSHRKAPRPKRMPVPERYHAATDPQAVTTWGKMAEIRMAGRGDVLRVASETLPPGVPYPWTKLGPPYQPPDYVQAAKPFLADWSRRVRMLAIITVHGALDLEMPELLLHLFPQWFQARFLLGGAFRGRPCNKTEGSAVMDALCASHHARARRPQRRRRESPGFLRRWGSRALRPKRRRHLFEGQGIFHPHDPRLRFWDEDPQRQGLRVDPDLVTVTTWADAMYLSQRFPEVPLIIYFGPPVMLMVGEDVLKGNKAIVEKHWAQIRALTQKAAPWKEEAEVRGEVFITGESLFRCEQFFWQTGVEVPFLRPMSTWVNATYFGRYAPQGRRLQGAEVLVHNRGRLKYETGFLEMLRI